MADSLIGYLNQQIQKTNQAQQEQQHSTSTKTEVTNANTLCSSENTTIISATQPNVFRSLDQQQVNPEQSQNIYPRRPSASYCVSSRGGLGISNIQTGNSTIIVSTRSPTISSSNVLSFAGSNVYSPSVRNRNGSMLLQQQLHSAQLSTPLTTQTNKLINMSSSGTILKH